MKPSLAWLLVALVSVSTQVSCSLDRPDRPLDRLMIQLDDQDHGQMQVLADPASASQINCFVVNVTGNGVPQTPDAVGGCISPDNFTGKGVGLFSKPVTRGNTISLDLPAGLNRTIDVYGIYPSLPECGGVADQDAVPSGYHLGRVTKDLLEPTSVTIPVSLSATALTNKFTCPRLGPSIRTYVYLSSSLNRMIAAKELLTTSGSMTDIATYSLTGLQNIRALPGGGTYIYVADTTLSTPVYALTNATGALTYAGSSGVDAGTSTINAIAPNRAWSWEYYSTMLYPNAISSGSPNALTAATPFAVTSTFITDLIIHPSSNWAYVMDNSTSLRKYTINQANGSFSDTSTAVSTHQHASITPDGSFIYTSSGGSTIFGYSVNATTGHPTVLAGSPYPISGYPQSKPAIDPLGRFAWIGLDAGIQRMTLNSSTGDLTTANVYDVATSGILSVDPSGKWLLRLRSNNLELDVYSINQSSGDLTTASSHTLTHTMDNVTIQRVSN